MSEEKTCKHCDRTLPLDNFHAHPHTKDRRQGWCKKCAVDRSRRYTQNLGHKSRLWWGSYNNAKRRGVEHTITPDDIPTPPSCKYLGVLLDYRRTWERGGLRQWDAPSIDRIDASRGYVPGNVQVISDLANRMKTDATIPQLIAFAEGVLRVHK